VITSYHVHSAHSDGTNSILEIVTAAAEQGIHEIGISDHLVYPVAHRPVPWSMSLDGLDTYFEELSEARQLVGNKIQVRFGLECDYEPKTAEHLSRVLNSYPLDYVIGSIHFLEDFPIDESPEHWDKLDEAQRNQIVRRYWRRLKELAESRLFDIVGHLDLYKKFGWRPSIDLTEEISQALDAIAKAGLVVEINTSGLRKPAREIYPSMQIIEMCRMRNIRMVITSDSHETATLTYGHELAREMLKNSGYESTVVFSNRKAMVLPSV
jgi:histidinol-phosphatase (PHP family)